MSHFGEHLTLDGYGGDETRLDNQELIKSCLVDLTNQLGMKILGGPEIYLAPGNDKKDPGGWSAFVVIEESHVSIHTFPKIGFISADVYTCRNGLDKDFITDYFKRTFELKDVEVNFIKRGTRYTSPI
jgi:S-adenosylmethionine decarboxylase